MSGTVTKTIARLYEVAKQRPPGYVEDVLSGAILNAARTHYALSRERYDALCRKYRQVPDSVKAHRLALCQGCDEMAQWDQINPDLVYCDAVTCQSNPEHRVSLAIGRCPAGKW